MKNQLHLNGKSFTCHACFLKAYFWRDSSLLKNLWVSKKRQYVSFPGDRNRGIVSRLFPYSNYKLEMVVTNGRGDGPRSEVKEFPTPEGGTFPRGPCRHPSLVVVWVVQLCRAARELHRSAVEPRCCRGDALGPIFSRAWAASSGQHHCHTALPYAFVTTGKVTSLQLHLELTTGTVSSI